MEGSGTRAACSLAFAGPLGARGREIRPWPWLFAGLVLLLVVLPARPQIGGLDFPRLQSAASSLGPHAERAAGEVRDLVLRIATADDTLRLRRVNEHVNRRVAFAADSLAWNQDDYWASAAGGAGQGRGRLRGLRDRQVLPARWPPARPWRGCAWSTCVPNWHLLIAARRQPGPHGAGLLRGQRRRAADPRQPVPDIVPASRRPDLTPVFSFNSEGLWNGAGRSAPATRWPGCRAGETCWPRARAEGFE